MKDYEKHTIKLIERGLNAISKDSTPITKSALRLFEDALRELRLDRPDISSLTAERGLEMLTL